MVSAFFEGAAKVSWSGDSDIFGNEDGRAVLFGIGHMCCAFSRKILGNTFSYRNGSVFAPKRGPWSDE